MFFSDITTQSKAVLCDILDDSAQVTNLIYMPQKKFLTVVNELFVNYMYSLLISIQILSVQGYNKKRPSNTG